MLCTFFWRLPVLCNAAFHFSVTFFIIMMGSHNMHFMNLEQPSSLSQMFVRKVFASTQLLNRLQFRWQILEQTLILMTMKSKYMEYLQDILSWGILLSAIVFAQSWHVPSIAHLAIGTNEITHSAGHWVQIAQQIFHETGQNVNTTYHKIPTYWIVNDIAERFHSFRV